MTQIFASNAILPMLSFVYWPTVVGPAREEAINIATLAGCIVGMILFGLLGDIYGRRKMYGIELIVLIVGNVGVLMSSNGFATGDGLNRVLAHILQIRFWYWNRWRRKFPLCCEIKDKMHGFGRD